MNTVLCNPQPSSLAFYTTSPTVTKRNALFDPRCAVSTESSVQDSSTAHRFKNADVTVLSASLFKVGHCCNPSRIILLKLTRSVHADLALPTKSTKRQGMPFLCETAVSNGEALQIGIKSHHFLPILEKLKRGCKTYKDAMKW